MPLSLPDLDTIRQALLRDLQNQRPDADTGPDSDYFVRASAVASAVEGLYQQQSWISRQIFPDSADRDFLEQHASMRGLLRRPAVAASGKVQLSGNPGARFDAGLSLRVGSVLYQLQQGGSLDEQGQAQAVANATSPGREGNQPPRLAAELMAAPPGVASRVHLIDMQGGADEESDSELLARLLDLIRRPPAGGNRHDYRRWALEVPGVANAYVSSQRKELGIVDVVITAQDGDPTTRLINQVSAHIKDQCPVTAICQVLAPKRLDVDIVVAVEPETGQTLDTLRPQLLQALQRYFATLQPQEVLYRSRLETLISELPGVKDRQLRSPAANVLPDTAWLRLRTLTLEKLP